MMERGKQPPQPDAPQPRKRGWRFYATWVVLALALAFVIQNTEETEVTFLFAETNLPLFFALVIAIALGIAIGWLVPLVRRRRDE